MRLELVKSIKSTGFSVNLFLASEPLKMLAMLFFLATALVITDAQAVECEAMQFLKNKSQGVSVLNNLCEAENKMSIGSRFILTPGGRLWLKAHTDNNIDFQLICQNRAARTVEVEFSNTFSPWITPKGFAQCSDWINHKLSCQNGRSIKNDFICAIAVIKPPEYQKVTNLERTTSVKMRTVNADKKRTETVRLSDPELINAVMVVIRSEVKLCRDLYQVEHPATVFWRVDVLGRIEKLSFANGDHLEPQFRSCVESVVKNVTYPKFNENVTFSPEL
jgi:hypothetical protein